MSVEVLSSEEWLVRLRQGRGQIPGAYRAMYSSWTRGIVTAPELMVVPLDDHMVHRGDGIFEAARVVDGAIFDLTAHLERLARSGQQIALELPHSLDEMKDICVATVRASGLRHATLRLFVGRGPGSFSPNPYECPAPQVYIVVTDFAAVTEESYRRGVRAMVSRVPQKHPFYAQIKSCNYLPNVLMKKESVDAGYDFSLGCDSSGYILEGATENLAMIDSKNRLLIPKFDYTLRGTTLLTLIRLIEKHQLGIRSIEFINLKVSDLQAATEIFMVGTTLEVLPVVEVEDSKIGTGQPGPHAIELRRLLQADMEENPERRTPVSDL